MSEPVVFFRECLVDAVVKVLVVRKDDVAANVVELTACKILFLLWGRSTHEAFLGDVGRGKTARSLVRVDDHP